ncbi:hypothetical protein [Pedobacter kyungheensis]|uniref:hypothetical protein n=1 Tax=Pedobacter kyungheensis TaxID=1069985 RepID=UPI0006909834|nr:hypothetical protein [Pedobacter kyungheensis]
MTEILNFNIDRLENYLKAYHLKSFSLSRFYEIFERERLEWGVRKKVTFLDFLEELLKSRVFYKEVFVDQAGAEKTLLTHGKQNQFTMLSPLAKNGYFAYRSAMELNRLCTGGSKISYLKTEHPRDRGILKAGNELTQDAITAAFESLPRVNKNVLEWRKGEVMLANGKKTDRLGVLRVENEIDSYCYTDLERTLIDIVVRPFYAGGTEQVLKAFKKAKQQLNIEKLNDYLQKLGFIYPYHQCVGYYLEKAGYAKKEYALFNKNKVFDFYLTHAMEYPDYIEKWKLYVPY